MHTTTMTRSTALIISLALSLNIDSANAQIGTRRRTSSTGRIVGGIIAGVAVLLLLFLLCCYSRRRRASRMNAMGGPGYTNNTGTGMGFGRFGAMPMFGARNGGGFFGGKQNYDNNSTLPQHQQPVGAGYGNDPYAAQAGTGGGFSNTAPPPYGKDGAGYAAPPGPPPAAHTTGQNGQFVGGFRS